VDCTAPIRGALEGQAGAPAAEGPWRKFAPTETAYQHPPKKWAWLDDGWAEEPITDDSKHATTGGRRDRRGSKASTTSKSSKISNPADWIDPITGQPEPVIALDPVDGRKVKDSDVQLTLKAMNKSHKLVNGAARQ
jgi:hypothetical protein